MTFLHHMKSMSNTKIIALIFGLSLFGAVTGVAAYRWLEQPDYKSFDGKQQAWFAKYGSAEGALPEQVNFRAAAALGTPAVVHIKSKLAIAQAQPKSNIPDAFRDFFGDGGNFFQYPSPAPQDASGSGVIIAEDGYVVTNNHVINGADKVEVILEDKRTYEAKIIGRDPSTDLALLKIEEKALPFIKFGNSDAVEVGDWVLAVGNPFNLTSTVTAGIVSAKGRNLNLLQDQYRIEAFIQTDAAVNPGNSGGALLNTAGELVGINTAIASQTGTYNGYSFAVPVNLVKKVMDDLLAYGSVQRGFLGISIRDVDAKFAETENLKVLNGVYVNEVNAGSGSEEAGVKKGDVILKVDGVGVKTVSELQEQIGRHRPGEKVSLMIDRNGTEKTLMVTLKNQSGSTSLASKEEINVIKELGASFSELTNAEAQKLNLRNGIKVTAINSGKLKSAGIRDGFIITQIDRQPIQGLESLQEAIAKAKSDGEEALLLGGIYPDGSKAFYAIGL